MKRHTGTWCARKFKFKPEENSPNKISEQYSKALKALEKDLIVNLAKYPDVIASAAREYSPAHIANYVFELAKLFNKFYHEESILKVDDLQVRNFRLDLASATATTLNKAMKLLGIRVPSRM